MKWAFSGLALLILCASAGAKELTLDEARGREISSIQFLGIVTKAPASFPMKVGDKVTPDNTNAAVIMTQQTASSAHDYVVSTTYASCYFFEDPAKPQAVKISFFSFQGGLAMKSSGGGLTPAFGIGWWGSYPKELDLLNPSTSFERDTSYGFAQETSLTSYFDSETGHILSQAKDDSFRVILSGKNSFEHNYYDANATIDWLPPKTDLSESLDTFTLGSKFEALRSPLPLGATQSEEGSLKSTGSFALNFPNTNDDPFATTLTGVNYGINITGKAVTSPSTDTSDFSGTFAAQTLLLLNGAPSDFLLWARPADSTEHSELYSNIVGRFHYANDLSLPSLGPTQYIRFDSVLSGGVNPGRVPDYARFYAGNNFEEPDVSSSEVPEPLIRSLGTNQGGVFSSQGLKGGASSFGSIDLTAAFPIPILSYPLIPRVDGSEGIANTVYQVAKDFGDSPQEINLDHFICYQANIASLKPVIVADSAWLGAPSGFSDRTIASVGGGIEATLVVVNFDLIYSHTVFDSSSQKMGGNLSFELSYEHRF